MYTILERFALRVNKILLKLFKNHKIFFTITLVLEDENKDAGIQHVWIPTNLTTIEVLGIIEYLKAAISVKEQKHQQLLIKNQLEKRPLN